MGVTTRNAPPGTQYKTLGWTPPPGTSPLIRRDLFPAAVSRIPNPDLTPRDDPRLSNLPPDPLAPHHPKARTIITQDSVFIFIDTPAGPDLLFTARLDSAQGDYRTGYQLTYTSASREDPQTPTHRTTLQIEGTGACGCGSRLPGFKPWHSMRYTAAPR